MLALFNHDITMCTLHLTINATLSLTCFPLSIAETWQEIIFRIYQKTFFPVFDTWGGCKYIDKRFIKH